MLRAMSATILDGKALSAAVRNQVRERIAKAGRPARLDAVLVGNDSAAELYAQNQARTCGEVGIEYRLHRLPEGSGFEEVAGRVLLLNEDESVRAIMVHLPLPTGVDVERVQSLIAQNHARQCARELVGARRPRGQRSAGTYASWLLGLCVASAYYIWPTEDGLRAGHNH